MPVLLLLVVFPTQVLTLCFGETFAGASPIVLPLAVGMFAVLFFGNPAGVLALVGNHNVVLRVNAVSAIALIVLGVVGAKTHGAYGLAIGTAAAAAFQSIVLWYLARKRIRLSTHIGYLSLPTRGFTSSPDASTSERATGDSAGQRSRQNLADAPAAG